MSLRHSFLIAGLHMYFFPWVNLQAKGGASGMGVPKEPPLHERDASFFLQWREVRGAAAELCRVKAFALVVLKCSDFQL